MSSLKKMPQRRRRRCSIRASCASLAMRSRSQFGLVLSVIFEPREVNHPIAFFHIEFYQPAAARSADAAAARRVVGRAMRRAKEVASVGIEKYSFLPVEFQRDMRAAVEVGPHGALVADGEGRRRLAEVFHLKAHAPAGVGERARSADQPLVASHRLSSGTLATQP